MKMTKELENEILTCRLEKVLNALEDMCREYCLGYKVGLNHRGLLEGSLITESNGLLHNARALRVLQGLGRFRIIEENCFGAMVSGYWPENDPLLNGMAYRNQNE